jgi:hypothetical protein
MAIKVSTGRRRAVATAMLLFIVALSFAGGAAFSDEMHNTSTPSLPVAQVQAVPVLNSVKRVPAVDVSRYMHAKQIPVLAYHAMDDHCAASEPTCKSVDYESVSAKQFQTEMQWLFAHDYHTVTISQYMEWLSNKRAMLPPHPILLVDDNGDTDFLFGAEPTLYHYRYTVAADIDTGFNQAATTGYCVPRLKVGGRFYDVQPNCGGPNTWNATWSQLEALSPQVYSYILEAGPDGHFQQTYNKNCWAFYACKMPGESVAAYKARVLADLHVGFVALAKYLPGRVTTSAWVAPYSDLGYPCTGVSCAYENYTGPAGWLIDYAQTHFKAVFVQDAIRAGRDHERFRYEIHNTTTLAQFSSLLTKYLADGDFKWG